MSENSYFNPLIKTAVPYFNRTIMTADRFFERKKKEYFLHIDTCEFVGEEMCQTLCFNIDAYDVKELLVNVERAVNNIKRFMEKKLISSITSSTINFKSLDYAFNRICAMQEAQTTLNETIKFLEFCKDKIVIKDT